MRQVIAYIGIGWLLLVMAAAGYQLSAEPDCADECAEQTEYGR